MKTLAGILTAVLAATVLLSLTSCEKSGASLVGTWVNNKQGITTTYILRADGTAAIAWYVKGTIEELEIGGVTVYKQRDTDGTWGRTMWRHGGVSYCLFYDPNFNLTEEDYEQIILSMLN